MTLLVVVRDVFGDKVASVHKERVGLFLLNAMLIVKLSLCVIHSLIKRPNHFIAYLCTFQNLGGWVGSSRMVVPLLCYHLTIVVVSSWYVSKKVKTPK